MKIITDKGLEVSEEAIKIANCLMDIRNKLLELQMLKCKVELVTISVKDNCESHIKITYPKLESKK